MFPDSPVRSPCNYETMQICPVTCTKRCAPQAHSADQQRRVYVYVPSSYTGQGQVGMNVHSELAISEHQHSPHSSAPVASHVQPYRRGCGCHSAVRDNHAHGEYSEGTPAHFTTIGLGHCQRTHQTFGILVRLCCSELQATSGPKDTCCD